MVNRDLIVCVRNPQLGTLQHVTHLEPERTTNTLTMQQGESSPRTITRVSCPGGEPSRTVVDIQSEVSVHTSVNNDFYW